jgi:hypothetical protein
MGKKALIKFESLHKGYPDIIVSSKKHIPKWYRDEKTPPENEKTWKNCVPFLESMTTGYTVLLPLDLLVKQVDGNPQIDWVQSQDGVRMVGFNLSESINRIPTPPGCYKTSFYWHFPVTFEVPVGYSTLLTHPINRFDLPFQSLSVVIDGGYTLTPYAFVTFFLREGFEGIIPQGTPIASIIPFKNESWVAEKTPGLIEKAELQRLQTTAVYGGWYKKTWWTKKHYN